MTTSTSIEPSPRECPICRGMSLPLDVVDFNKSCEESRGKYLPLSCIPIYYSYCETCGFCFAPAIYAWSRDEFAARIYNEDYAAVDPDYVSERPLSCAKMLGQMLEASELRHLDYGGGEGLLSDLMRDSGWRSVSYDPFVDTDTKLRDLGTFDLITAFEVFEHVSDPGRLVKDLAELLDGNGLVLFSTLLSDGKVAPRQRLNWWYAAPRNGHISLFSRKSLEILGAREGFSFGSFDPDLHAFWRVVPPWAAHLITQA